MYPSECNEENHLFQHQPTNELYTLSLHDALPISGRPVENANATTLAASARAAEIDLVTTYSRSEEHTSELQSRENLVCRLLLEKKKGSASQAISAPPEPT